MAGLWATAVFLLGAYWPYALAALVIGLMTGWLSRSPSRAADQ